MDLRTDRAGPGPGSCRPVRRGTAARAGYAAPSPRTSRGHPADRSHPSARRHRRSRPLLGEVARGPSRACLADRAQPLSEVAPQPPAPTPRTAPNPSAGSPRRPHPPLGRVTPGRHRPRVRTARPLRGSPRRTPPPARTPRAHDGAPRERPGAHPPSRAVRFPHLPHPSHHPPHQVLALGVAARSGNSTGCPHACIQWQDRQKRRCRRRPPSRSKGRTCPWVTRPQPRQAPGA